MKKILVLILVLFTSNFICPEDTILLKNGSFFVGSVVSLYERDITFTSKDITYIADIGDVIIININSDNYNEDSLTVKFFNSYSTPVRAKLKMISDKFIYVLKDDDSVYAKYNIYTLKNIRTEKIGGLSKNGNPVRVKVEHVNYLIIKEFIVELNKRKILKYDIKDSDVEPVESPYFFDKFYTLVSTYLADEYKDLFWQVFENYIEKEKMMIKMLGKDGTDNKNISLSVKYEFFEKVRRIINQLN